MLQKAWTDKWGTLTLALRRRQKFYVAQLRQGAVWLGEGLLEPVNIPFQRRVSTHPVHFLFQVIADIQPRYAGGQVHPDLVKVVFRPLWGNVRKESVLQRLEADFTVAQEECQDLFGAP